jgi:hypothetical protein
VSVLVGDREVAQSDSVLRRLSGVSSVWVFAESLFEAYMTVFATELTFAMRRAARQGLPMVGVGAGAMALGGLLVARRVCIGSQYDLVTGLGWASRELLSDKVQATLKEQQRPGVEQLKRTAPPPPDAPTLTVAHPEMEEDLPAGRVCPMCNKVHEDTEPQSVELAA